MIERIVWNKYRGGGDGESPFQNGNNRPLRLTFHNGSFGNLSEQDRDALVALQELVRLKEIEAIGTGGGSLPNIEVVVPDHDIKDVQVRLKSDVSERGTGFANYGMAKTCAADICGDQNQLSPEFKVVLQDVLMVRAHLALSFDIFITCSPALLRNRGSVWLREANLRSPADALKIVGLFRRSKGDYVLGMIGETRYSFDRGLFYGALARRRLPGIWHYFGSCLDAGRARGDDTGMMAQSALVRVARAYEARDAIGRLFYVPQGNNVRDETMYHFEYLLVLLAGSFDSLARIAHRAYGIKESGERHAYLHKVAFQKELAKKGAKKLANTLGSGAFENLAKLLYELRNTIHGASLSMLAYSENAESQKSYLAPEGKQAEMLFAAAECYDSATAWGFKRSHKRMYIEPFSFANKLLLESIKHINMVLESTDLTGLFPAGHVLRNYPAPPADDRIFGEHIGRRLDVLV